MPLLLLLVLLIKLGEWVKLGPHNHSPLLNLAMYAATQPHLDWSKVSIGQPGAIVSVGDKFMQLAGLMKGFRHMPVVERSSLASGECTSFTLIESVELSRHTRDLGQHYLDLHWNP